MSKENEYTDLLENKKIEPYILIHDILVNWWVLLLGALAAAMLAYIAVSVRYVPSYTTSATFAVSSRSSSSSYASLSSANTMATTLQKIISSKNYGTNPIILEFEADATQAGLSGANVEKILVKSGATLSLEDEWWLEDSHLNMAGILGDSYNALEVEKGATLQILNGKTLTAGQAFTATVDGKMRAENASKVQGNVTIDGTGVVEVATADFSWTKGTFSGDWTK